MNYPPRANEDEVCGDFEKRCAPNNITEIPNSCVIGKVGNDFITINKPPDIRLNGEFDVTVEKLILNWFPQISSWDLKWFLKS